MITLALGNVRYCCNFDLNPTGLNKFGQNSYRRKSNMPLCSAAVGSLTPPHLFEVTAGSAIAYAARLGDSHPRYLDDAAMQGILAHPAFCVAV